MGLLGGGMGGLQCVWAGVTKKPRTDAQCRNGGGEKMETCEGEGRLRHGRGAESVG